MFMHPLQMLLEIVQSRPFLVVLGATIPETLEHSALAMCWCDFMNALLVPLQVVDGGKALLSWTFGDKTCVLLFVSSFMFPIANS